MFPVITFSYIMPRTVRAVLQGVSLPAMSRFFQISVLHWLLVSTFRSPSWSLLATQTTLNWLAIAFDEYENYSSTCNSTSTLSKSHHHSVEDPCLVHQWQGASDHGEWLILKICLHETKFGLWEWHSMLYTCRCYICRVCCLPRLVTHLERWLGPCVEKMCWEDVLRRPC